MGSPGLTAGDSNSEPGFSDTASFSKNWYANGDGDNPSGEQLYNATDTRDAPYPRVLTSAHTNNWAMQGRGPASSSTLSNVQQFGYNGHASSPYLQSPGYDMNVAAPSDSQPFNNLQPDSDPLRSSSPWSPVNLRITSQPHQNVASRANPINTGRRGGYSIDASSNQSFVRTNGLTKSSHSSSDIVFTQGSFDPMQVRSWNNVDTVGTMQVPPPSVGSMGHCSSSPTTTRNGEDNDRYGARDYQTLWPNFETGQPGCYNDSIFGIGQHLPLPPNNGQHRELSSQTSSVGDPTSPPTGETPLTLPCNKCEVQFTGDYRKGNHARHLRIQHGGGRGVPRTFDCSSNICTKTFRRKDAMLKHIRRHHPELGSPAPVTRKHTPHRRSY